LQALPFRADDAESLFELCPQGGVVRDDLPQTFLGDLQASQQRRLRGPLLGAGAMADIGRVVVGSSIIRSRRSVAW
jgi:hypothetical protein